MVTVGSFNSLDDPNIAKFRKAFGAKIKEHALTKRPFLAAEQLTIPPILKGNQLPERAWILRSQSPTRRSAPLQSLRKKTPPIPQPTRGTVFDPSRVSFFFAPMTND